MKYLGIDYGTKKIGLAVSDTEGNMAFPYMLLKNDKDPVHTIADIITKEHIEHTVLGYSVDHTGKENSVMKFVHDFKEQLEKVTQIPVSFQKEFMTSVFARQDFDGKSKNNARQVKQKKMGDDDMAAAVLILQRFLEKK